MALFQKSVLNQYLKQLDKNEVAKAYTIFKSHFHNTTIQQQIRESKEEQYQEGFFRDLFVEVLGFTLNPQPNYNLITEQKNEVNSKKADGAILKNNEVVAVIELKGTNTTDLNTVTSQAFGYKNNQKNCKYVLISNFEKVRFYIDNAIDFEEFDLFTLTAERFEILYLCLQANNLLTDLPDKIKQASTVKEENVTKQLYKDYSDFKRKLFTDIVQLNPQYDKLILFKKSQKLLDRILFILFAEDRGLLQANTIQTILDEFENLKKLDAYSPLYDRFKKHFTYLNEGFKNEKYEVFGYNGGLFAPDEILDSILISDNLLLNYTPALAKYDYETDVDVNILGHIFEHSLNDIEEIQAELEGKEIDKPKTKRKKDGVFYTPKYITKYIVENTVGALCTEKRNEYGIVEDNYTPDKRKAKKKELLQSLDNYQNWLLEITIVDPACGSGAFLNQALDFLIQEHKSIDELRAQLLGHSFVLSDHEISILENNIFGVDLNEESVEIARLSLWLRTARKGRKLNSLNNNIKCGNSLIDDKAIAGEKAFNWQTEFSQIFAKGGFDVVIGNPPYVATKQIPEVDRNYFWGNYKELLFSEMDLYEIFLYKSIKDFLSKDGFIGFITPNSYYTNVSFRNYREYLLNNTTIIEIIDFPYRFYPFQEVNTETSIIIIKNSNKENFENTLKLKVVNKELQQKTNGLLNVFTNQTEIKQELIKTKYNYQFIVNTNSILNKIIENENKFGDYLELHKGWMSIPESVEIESTKYSKGIFTEFEINTNSILSKVCNKFLEGRDIHRYYIDLTSKYVCTKNIEKKTKEWHFSPKIILQRIVGQNRNKIFATVDFENYIIFPNANLVNLKVSNHDVRFYITILNSTLISYFYNVYFGESNTNLTKLAFESIPIPNILNVNQQTFIEKADIMLSKNKELQTIKSNVVKLLQSRYSGININTKLGNWNELSFKDFCKELEKQKIKLPIAEQAELMQYFEAEQSKANTLQQTITQTDKEIDQMVYKLYELTDEEIKIVENS